MDAAGLFLAAVVTTALIAVATGGIALFGILQVLGPGGGLRRDPPRASGSILARQRAVDARLRNRYLARRTVLAAPASSHDEQLVKVPDQPVLDEPVSAPSAQPALPMTAEGSGFVVSLVDRPAG